MKKQFAAIIIFIMTGISVSGQSVISEEKNKSRPDDKIIKQQVGIESPGIGGARIFWDFSRTKKINDSYLLRYHYDDEDTTLFAGIEHQTAYFYKETGDSLQMYRYKNRTVRMEYAHPECRLRYPFQYGDTIQGTFSASGYYSQKIPLKLDGDIQIKADAWGMLVIPSGDTIRQILRVHTLRNCLLKTGTDSTRIFHDAYAWYARGYRYPVFESITTRQEKDSTRNHMQISFLYSPESQGKLTEDIINDDEWYAMLEEYKNNPGVDSLHNGKWRDQNGNIIKLTTEERNKRQNKEEVIPEELKDICDYFKLYPVPVKDRLTVSYNLKKLSAVGFSIFDSGFRTVKQTAARQQEEGNHNEEFDLSALQPGEYHIHCRINGYEIKHIFIKSL